MGNKNLTVINKEGIFVVDSREVAEMVGKRHSDLLESIDMYIKHLTDGNFRSLDFFIDNTYQDSKNETRKCYLLTKQGCDMVANKMTGKKGILFTATYINKFYEMEEQIKNQTPMFAVPKTFKEALMLAVQQQEKIELLESTVGTQQKEIEYKEDVIVGLVDEISLAEKRQILNRVVRKCNNYQERWIELYKQFEMKYHLNLKARLDRYNLENKPKAKSKLDYIDKVMNKIPDLYEIACKLYENDVKELVNEIYELQASNL
jgi:Rha family phage regulatory protein